MQLLKYTNNVTNKEVVIFDNKFIMSAFDVTIQSSFVKKNIVKNPNTGGHIGMIILSFGVFLVLFIVTIFLMKKIKQ